MSIGRIFSRFFAVWFFSLVTAAAALAQPTFTKSFSPDTIGPGSVSTLTFTIDNSSGGLPVTGLAFTDVMPAAVQIKGDLLSTNCVNGTLTGADGASTITYVDGELGAGAVCTVTVQVTASTPGAHTNTSGDLTSDAGNSGSATDDLTVDTTLPGFSKAFAPSSVSLGGSSTLTFTFDNTLNASPIGALDFTDNLPVGLVVADPANAASDCVSPGFTDTTVTAVAGGSSIVLDANGSTFFPGFEVLAAGASCTVTVDVKATGAGTLVNQTSSALADFTAVGFAQAELEVTVAALNIAKDFVDDPAVPGGTVEVEFTIDNFSRTEAATGLAFTDDLGAALSGLTYDSLLSNDCGGSVGGAGTTSITFSGGTLAPEGQCTIRAALSVPAAATPGSYPNTTSAVTATVGGVTVTGNMATDTLSVSPAPLLTVEILEVGTLNPDPVVFPGDDVVMRYTISNLSTTSAATDVTFLHDLIPPLPFPVGVTLPPNPDPACGAGSSVALVFIDTDDQGLELTGGSLAAAPGAGSTCTFDVTVTIPEGMAPNTYTFASDGASATVDGATRTGQGASDTLTVGLGANVSFAKAFAGPVAPGGTVDLTFDITSTGDSAAVSAITFTDDLAALVPALSGATFSGTLPTDPCGTGSSLAASAGDTLLTLASGSLAADGDSCSFTVSVAVPVGAAPGTYINTTSDLGATVRGLGTTFRAAEAELTVAALNFTKEFLTNPVIAGDTTTLRFTIENLHPTDDATITFFTDNLSAALTGLAATGPAISDDCGGALSGTTFLTYVGGSVPAGDSCVIEVPVLVPAAAPDGDYTNSTSSLSTSLGTIDPAIATLNVQSTQVQLTKAFTDDPVAAGEAVTLEFTLENLNTSAAVSNIAFTDNLGDALTGLTFDSVLFNDCDILTTVSGTGTDTISVTGGNLGAGGTCTIRTSLTVPAGAASGGYTNTTSDVTGTMSGFAISGDPASDTLNVTSTNVQFSKAFDGPVGATGTATLTFTLTNNGTSAVAGLSFTDDLDAVLSGLVATSLNAGSGCGTGASITGTSVLSFAGGEVAASGGTCVITADVLVPASAAAGSYPNTTSAVFAAGLQVANPATATLTVEPAPGFAKSFAPDPVAAGAATTLTFTIDNTASAIAASALDFTDNLPPGVLVASPANASTTCTGGTTTAVSGSGVIEYSAGTVAAGASCTLSVDVTAAASGDYTNTSGALTSSSGSSGFATDTLRVNPQPGFAIGYAPNTLPTGFVSTVTYTVDNTGSTVAASSLDFSHTLPVGEIATPSNASTTCTGGAVTAASGSAVVGYTGGTVGAGATCTVTVDVTSSTAGSFTATTGDLTSSLGNSGSASAPITFVLQPGFAKTFAPDTVAIGASTTLTFTINNTSPLVMNSIDFTDTLPTGMVVATPANAATTCTSGTLTATSGTGVIAYTGGNHGPNLSCTVSVDVTTAAAGDFVNTSGDLTTSLGNSGTATDTLTVVPPPAFAKGFAPQTLPLGFVSTLTFTVDNSGSALPATALGFSDSLPAGMIVATPSNAATTCTGGTLTATDGSGSISYAGGSLAASTSCTVTVDVTSTATGDLLNTSGDLTSALGNSGTASATMTVVPQPTFAKAFAPSTISLGQSSTLTFTVNNTSPLVASALDFSDTLPAGLAVAAVPNASTTCTGGTLTAVGGAGTISYTGGTAGPALSCTVSVDVTPTVAGALDNLSGDLTSALGNSGTAAATLTVITPEIDISGSIGGAVAVGGTLDQGATLPAGTQQTLIVTVTNTGTDVLTIDRAATFSADSNVAVTIYDALSPTVPIGGSTTFRVDYTPSSTILNDPTVSQAFSFDLSLGNTDVDENPYTFTVSGTALDTTAPSGYTAVFDQDPVNAAGQTGVSYTFANAEVGAGYAYTITSDGGGAPVTGAGTIATATDVISGIDVSGLADGTLTLTVALTDAAGNVGIDTTDTAAKDTTAPAVAIDTPLSGDGLVSAAEAAGFVLSGTSSGIPDGNRVEITISVDGVTVAGLSTTVTGDVWTLPFDMTFFTDGSISVFAIGIDQANNPSPQATASGTLDTTAPTGHAATFDQDPVNIGNQAAASFAFSGAEAGATYAFSITSDAGGTPVTGTGTIATATDQITGIDLSGLNDGTLTLTVALTDPAGNTGTDATDTATKDTVAPGLTIDAPIEGDDVVNAAEAPATVISGTATGLVDGSVVTVAVDDGASGTVTDTTTVTGGLWTITLDLSVLADGALVLTADASDAAGNPSPQATAAATLDTTAPTGYSAIFDQDPVNLANQTAVSFTFAGAEVAATYAFSITSDAGGTPVTGTGTIATATDQITGIDLSGLNDGTLTLTVALTDPAGNTGTDATDTATKDATVPSVAFDAPIEDDDVVNAAEAPATVISGTSTDLEDGAVVTVVVSDGGTGTVTDTATVTGNVWSMTPDLSGLADGPLSLTADVSDAAGNPAPQATASATKDATAPSGYTAAFDQDPVNLANQTAIGFTFAAAELGTTYAYSISSDGGGTPVSGSGLITSASQQITGLDLSGLGDGTLTLTVDLTDPAGNTGIDATATATKDAVAPSATLVGPAAAQADPFLVTLTFSEPVTGLNLTSVSLINGTASALTGSGDSYGFTVTPDHDGPVEIALDAAAAADAAGNPSTVAAAITVTADLTGTPNPTPLPDADGDGVADIYETGDRDGDGIPDEQDFDPQGYFYCEDDGRIIPGGGFTVTGPAGSNSTLGTTNFINITRDGSTGEIQWFALRPGTYAMSLSYPTTVGIPSTARLSSGTLDLTSLLPSNPAVIGSSEFGSTGFLADTSLAANPAFYTSFDIEPGDPFVLSNNIPMTQCAENLVTVSASTDGAEANGGAPTDATFTVTQGRLSTVDTVIAYTVAGSATSGTDFTALSGTVTIPAGAISATITVPVLEDGDIEGPETVEITLTGVTSGDLTTLLGATVTGSATITDDDFADIAVVNVDLVTNEGGGDDATMTFVLLGSPTSPVTLSFSGDNQCKVSPATMTFTAADYTVAQALTIRAIDDDKVEGTHSCQPTVVVSSPDARYDGAPLALATVTVTDDLVDQIREPLTEILEDDLEETITAQTKAFSGMAKGALQRLQAGRDLPCGTIQGFDVDGSVEIQDATGSAQGTFGRDAYNCVTDRREILDGSFSLNKTEDTGVQALFQFAWQRERFVSDQEIAGYFLGGYYSRTDVSGQGDGSIDGFGVNGGLYGARGFAQGLFLDYYVAGAAGRHNFDIDFDAAAAPINATGEYSYLAGFAGLGISGERTFDTFVMKPRVGLDLAYAKAGDADVTATQLGLTHNGVIDLDDFSGARATAEIRFESLSAPGGAEALAGMMRTAFTPRFTCEMSSYDDDTNCGVGLAFAWERTDAASGLTWGFEVDVEQIDDSRRFTFNINRERMIFNGLGSVVSRLSMPAMQEIRVEHGVQLDF